MILGSRKEHLKRNPGGEAAEVRAEVCGAAQVRPHQPAGINGGDPMGAPGLT